MAAQARVAAVRGPAVPDQWTTEAYLSIPNNPRRPPNQAIASYDVPEMSGFVVEKGFWL